MLSDSILTKARLGRLTSTRRLAALEAAIANLDSRIDLLKVQLDDVRRHRPSRVMPIQHDPPAPPASSPLPLPPLKPSLCPHCGSHLNKHTPLLCPECNKPTRLLPSTLPEAK